MDSIILQSLAAEVAKRIDGSRIDRIIQVGAGTMVLRIWTGRERQQLCLQADGDSHFFLTTQSFAAPATPPRFCQLLRARLRRLVKISVEPFDRIIHFVCAGADNKNYDLVFELLSKQSNMILVDLDTGLIVDLLRRLEGPRILLPGQLYQLPEQSSYLPLTASAVELDAALSAHDRDVAAMLVATVYPMSLALALAVATEVAAGKELSQLLCDIQQRIAAAEFQPRKVRWAGGSGLLPFAIGDQAFNTIEAFDSFSALFDSGVSENESTNPQGLGEKMLGVIKRQEKKLKKRLKHIQQDQQRYVAPEALRITGDLLLANLHLMRRGMDSIEVDDYYQSPPTRVKIELDSKLLPQENAERLFHRYRKAKRAGDHHARRLEETEAELLWLEELHLTLDEAASPDDLFQIQTELEAAGLLQKVKGQLGKRPAVKIEDQLLRAETPGGRKLFWGKNSRTNDYVSRSLTGPKDLWFHAHGMPGCHLVLKCGEAAGSVSDEDILCAASFAAGYSKGKDAGKVDVIVAQGRDVKKPKGARPGLVTVETYKTVMVVPKRLDK